MTHKKFRTLTPEYLQAVQAGLASITDPEVREVAVAMAIQNAPWDDSPLLVADVIAQVVEEAPGVYATLKAAGLAAV